MKTLIKYLLVCAIVFTSLNGSAQNARQQRQSAKAEHIKNMVTNIDYVFKANYVNPQRGGSRALTSDYDLAVSKDTINAYLPYFGRAFVAPINPTEGGIKFKTAKFDYKAKSNKKGGWDVLITPKDRNISDMRDVQTLRLNISQNGFASLQVISSNRDPISFDGYIESREKK
jgi:hypothetical protein